ncbi:MAG: hypothetical protein WB699_07590 [Bacteroidota bacterium]
MDYTITPSTDGLFIILKIKGNITRQTAMQLNLEAHALGKQLKIRRYLVDVTEARNTDGEMETFKFAYSDMQKMEGIDRFARVATLVSPNDHSHDFMETVAVNSGLNVKLFRDAEEAMRFLMKDIFPDNSDKENR